MSEERSTTARQFAVEATEDLAFQVRSWRVQRIGWLVGLLLLGLAFAGLFGRGLLSTARSASADGGIEVTYEMFARHGAPSQIDVRVGPALVAAGNATVWITRDFLEGVELQEIIPEPSRVLDAQGRTGFEFEAGDVGAEGLNVTFLLEYDEIFVREADVSVGDQPAVRIRQMVYP